MGGDVSGKGHMSVGLYKSGKGETKLIHRLVAEHFIENPNRYPLVDHIDGNPSNNASKNLRWADFEHNNRNTPYVRYLQTLPDTNNIRYEDQYEFDRKNHSSS